MITQRVLVAVVAAQFLSLLACSSKSEGGGATDDDVCVTGCDGDSTDASDNGPGDDGDAGGDDGPTLPSAPLLRNTVTLDDASLAAQATALLGVGTSGNCASCHTLTQERLQYWATLSGSAIDDCMTNLALPTAAVAQQIVTCLQTGPEYTARKVGIYSAAAHLDWFAALFERAGATDYNAFEHEAAMPRGASPAWTQAQFDIVAEWLARGLPLLGTYASSGGSVCADYISATAAQRIADGRSGGWRALNEANGLSSQDLDGFPLASAMAYGTDWATSDYGSIRVLEQLAYATQYETRSSPDGRFVAHGKTTSAAAVIDLGRDVTISVNAWYEPSFSPDSAAFMFQPAKICSTTVLTSLPTSVTLTEPSCGATSTVGLQQSIGSTLEGGTEIALSGDFVGDDGGKQPTLGDPEPSYSADSNARFTPLVYNGEQFVAQAYKDAVVHYKGDWTIAPSTRMAVARVGGSDGIGRGYALHDVDLSTSSATLPEIARYCVDGGIATFSYDERWLVYHHYIADGDRDAVELGFTGRTDPGFASYASKGAANLYLLDLTTGLHHRITTMRAGQYALYPHFRSDGWIYALVRDDNTGTEYVIASEAARIAETR